MDDHACLRWCRCASAFDIAAAAAVDGYLPNTYEFTGGQSYDVSTFQETALGFVFFTWFTVFPIIGLLVGVAGRGFSIQQVTRDGFPTILSNRLESSSTTVKSPSCLGCSSLGHIWHFDQGSVADRLRLGGLGGVEATVSLATILPFLRNRRNHCFWNGRRALVHSSHDADLLWILFQVGSWLEAGFWTNETFEESWAPLIWLAITFFVGVQSH